MIFCRVAVEQSGSNLGNTPLTQTEVVKGLKNELTTGTDTAIRRLTASDGFLLENKY